jgi:hypothetical protein
MTNTEPTPYQEGAQAQRDGKPHKRSPHDRDTAAAKGWYDGWYDSYFAHKLGEPWRSDLKKNGVGSSP